MTQLLNADTLNDCITELVTHAIQYSNKKRKPKAVIIVASDDKASKIYVNNKVKTGEKLGIDIEVRPEQLINIDSILTASFIIKLDKSISVNSLHPEKKYLKSKTLLASNVPNFKVFNAPQFVNIYIISVTLETSKLVKSKSVNAVHL